MMHPRHIPERGRAALGALKPRLKTIILVISNFDALEQVYPKRASWDKLRNRIKWMEKEKKRNSTYANFIVRSRYIVSHEVQWTPDVREEGSCSGRPFLMSFALRSVLTKRDFLFTLRGSFLHSQCKHVGKSRVTVGTYDISICE